MRLHGSLGLIFLLGLDLFGARAFFLKPSIEPGESATLVLSAKGEKIHFPAIEQIEGFSIVAHQSRQSIELNNGVMSKQLDAYFTFYPDRNVTIPSYEISVDGAKEMTEPLHLTVASTPLSASQKEPFSFEMNVSNTSPLQHEGVKLSFIFKRNQNETLMDMRFTKPALEGFWVKELGQDAPQVQNGEVVHALHYMLYPQKSGEFHIEPAKIEVARQVSSREMFFNQVQWKSIRSNDITLHVKPLEGVDILGHFTMQLQVDKDEIASNEPLNVTLKITGEGNLDDIEPFNFSIPDATVFSDAPKVTTWMDGEKLKGEFVQKFAINAQKTFEIAPMTLRFYDPSLKQIERIVTPAKSIHVRPLAHASEKGVAVESIGDAENVWRFDTRSFLLGMALIVLIGIVLRFGMRLRTFHNPLKSSAQRVILQKLLKHQGKSDEVDSWIEKLEANLYRGEKHPINRKAIGKILENFV